VLFCLTNAFGVRVYADDRPTRQDLGLKAATLADGTFLADGARDAGRDSWPLLSSQARVLSFGRLRETLTPLRGRLAASLGREETGSLTVVLANSGSPGPFSRMEAMENLLGATGEVLVGFDGVLPRDYLTRFRGRVWSYTLEQERITLNLRAL